MAGEGRPSTKWHPGARVGVRGAVRLSALLQGSVSSGRVLAGGRARRAAAVCGGTAMSGVVAWSDGAVLQARLLLIMATFGLKKRCPGPKCSGGPDAFSPGRWEPGQG